MSDFVSHQEAVLKAAEGVARSLMKANVDLNEATKAGKFYLVRGCNEQEMLEFLHTMSENPPPRSRQSKLHYQGILNIWVNWRPDLSGRDKARAWLWAVRMCKGKGNLVGGR